MGRLEEPGASNRAAGDPTISEGKSVGIDNALRRLWRRSCTIFCFWAELEDLAGVEGEVE